MKDRGDVANIGAWRSPLRGLSGLALLGVAALLVAGCHTQRTSGENPVAVSMPGEASDKAHDAQQTLIDAVDRLGRSYDEAACTGEERSAERSASRQAHAEAHLEMRRAIANAQSEAEPGADEDDDSIIFFEEGAPEPYDRGGWRCMQAEEKPECARAAANNVSRRIVNHYVRGYEMNPITAGDAMEAFAAEIESGTQTLVEADQSRAALDQIEERCRAGESPLARFFEAASQFDHPDVRHDVERLRRDFVGGQRDVCAALPNFYAGLMGEMRAELERRTRTERCQVERWDPLWD